MPLVRTPYMLVASQYDKFQLGENLLKKPVSAFEKAYESAFAARTTAVVKSLRSAWPANSTQNAVFSWACYNHAVSEETLGFDKLTCQNTTMHSALNQFL